MKQNREFVKAETDMDPVEKGAIGATAGWKGLNRMAALAILVPLGVLVFDIWASLVYGAAPTGQRPVAEWFALFRHNPVLGLQGLSFPQLISTLCGLPLTVALFGALRHRNPGFAGLGLVLGLVGAVLFLDASAALPIWALSGRWQLAASEAERNALIAAGEAILARAADFTPAGFLCFFLPSLSGMIFAGLMARVAGFGPGLAGLGLGGYGIMAVFTVGACFVPGAFAALLPLCIGGGLALMVWQVWLAFRLWRRY